MMHRSSGYRAATGACALVAIVSQAHASSFAVRENSSEGVATVFSGDVSAADSAATAFNNPASMTQLHGNHIEVGAVAGFPTIDFHGVATNAGTSLAGNNGNNAGRPGVAPNFYAVLDLSDNFKFGFALTTPFALSVKQNASWYGRYLAIDTAVLSTDINPSVAYKINDRISIGAGVSAQWLQGTLARSLNQSALGASDALVRFKGDDWGFGYNLGAFFKPWNGTQIGLTYRSKISHQLHGDLDFLSVAPPLSGALISGTALLDANLPASTTFGITQAVTPRLNVSLTAQWTQWSAFKYINIQSTTGTAPINLGFSDSWFTSIGASYQWDDAWSLRGGIGWDQSPVDNRYRTVSIPDQDRYMIGLGFGYKITDALTLDGAYAHYFATRASINGSINNTDNNPFGATVLNGTYQLSLDYVSMSVGYKF
jgi:long-chain fatty acid transport protein